MIRGVLWATRGNKDVSSHDYSELLSAPPCWLGKFFVWHVHGDCVLHFFETEDVLG